MLFLLPAYLSENTSITHFAPVIQDYIMQTDYFFVENEKTARRFFKRLWKEMVIDNYEWHAIHKAEEAVKTKFIQLLKDGKNIGIVSEAGCPGIADPGQILVEAAQQMNATVHPLVGPNSILLALMASGMNGQCFQFVGYLPIESSARKKTIKELEEYSYKKNCTQIFIETPYRNNQLINDVLNMCKAETKFCIAVDITASTENIKTKTIKEWKQEVPELNKRLAIFLLLAN